MSLPPLQASLSWGDGWWWWAGMGGSSLLEGAFHQADPCTPFSSSHSTCPNCCTGLDIVVGEP